MKKLGSWNFFTELVKVSNNPQSKVIKVSESKCHSFDSFYFVIDPFNHSI